MANNSGNNGSNNMPLNKNGFGSNNFMNRNRNPLKKDQNILRKANGIPIGQNNNRNSFIPNTDVYDDEDELQEKSKTQQLEEKVASKATSSVIQAASGGAIPKPVADAISNKVAEPLVKAARFRRKVYLIMACIPLLFLLLMFVIFVGSSDDNEKKKDSYFTGEMTDDELYKYLESLGYCEKNECASSKAAYFYKSLKSGISDVSKDDKIYVVNLALAMMGYERTDKQLFSVSSDEVTSVLNKLKELNIGKNTDLDNNSNLQEYIIGTDGYISTYRTDITGNQAKVYDAIIKDAKSKNENSEYFKEKSNSSRTIGKYCSVGDTQASIFASMSTSEFLEVMGPIAQADYSRTGILASVTLSQAIIESGWGKYHIGNNAMFGIKCTSVNDDSVMTRCVNTGTQEEVNGQMISIVDGFADYDSVEDSVYDHSLYLTQNSRYSGITNTTNPREQIRIIRAGGYATSSSYESTLNGVIDNFNLEQWDKVINTGSSCSSAGVSGWNVRTIAPTSSDKAFTYITENRGQCVWYAQARAIEIAQELAKSGKITQAEADNIQNKLLGIYGDSGVWVQKASPYFNTSTNVNDLKAGSIISWSGGAGGWGHVAVIEEVTENSVTVTEGWSTYSGTASCPNDWGCVNFLNRTFDMESFKNNFGPSYDGGRTFEGYIYFLEPKS